MELANILNGKFAYHKGIPKKQDPSIQDLVPWRVAMMFGIDESGMINTENPPSRDRSMYSQVRYKFMLDAPFEISNKCCNVSKKSIAHKYSKDSGRHPITGQTASESRLRTQQWIRNGCNGFDMKEPISNPMSFWTEQDVLMYIKIHDIKLASVYGEVITDNYKNDNLDGQLTIADIEEWGSYGIFDNEVPLLKTSGCHRTGCVMCGYGCHLEKEGETRWDIAMRVSNPNIVDFCLRGGAFDENGLWKPDNRGLGYWFIFEWMNKYGNMKYKYPNREGYVHRYRTPETDKYLKD